MICTSRRTTDKKPIMAKTKPAVVKTKLRTLYISGIFGKQTATTSKKAEVMGQKRARIIEGWGW
jgi:hypothetical protein